MKYYGPMESPDPEGKKAFYEQLKAVEERLPKDDIPVVMGELCAKVSSDNIFFGHAMGKHGSRERNNNGKRFAASAVSSLIAGQ